MNKEWVEKKKLEAKQKYDNCKSYVLHELQTSEFLTDISRERLLKDFNEENYSGMQVYLMLSYFRIESNDKSCIDEFNKWHDSMVESIEYLNELRS